MIEEINNHIDPDNDISYGINNRGNEVIIVNEREIFHKKNCGKRTINNNFTISWICKNRHQCRGTLMSTRDVVDLEGSDYLILKASTIGSNTRNY